MSTEVKTLTIADTVNRMTPEFARALPKHIPSERFTRVAISAINGNPDILKAERTSLYAACMKAAQDGLILDGREAALVMFGNKAQYMPMLAGVLKKMRNSGEIAGITCGVVFQNEFDQGRFKYVKGDIEQLEHNPILFGDKGSMIGVYAVVTTKDGFKIREFMDMAQINKVKAVSRSANNGPWKSWFEEMALKTVLRRVAKLCPSSSDLDAAFESDDETSGIQRDVTPEPVGDPNAPVTAPVKTNKALDRVKATVQTPAQTEAEYVEVHHEQPAHEVTEEELPI